jgi:hypothetical protein
MDDLPFDSVTLLREGKLVRLTTAEFLALPMDERVGAILQRSVQFYAHGQLMDRSTALKRLRASSER